MQPFQSNFMNHIPTDSFLEYQKEIRQENRRTLHFLSRTGVILFFLLFILSFVIATLEEHAVLYLIAFFLFGIFELIDQYAVCRWESITLPILYIEITCILVASILLGTVRDRSNYAVSFIGLICVLPPLILDRPTRILLYDLSVTALFCALSYLVKPQEIWHIDCTNALSFFAVGYCVARFLLRYRLSTIVGQARFIWNDWRYRAILGDHSDIIFDYDMERKSCYLSEQGKRYFNIDRPISELVGCENIVAEDQPRFEAMMNELEGDHATVKDELRLITKDGSPIWFALSLTALMGSDGRRSRFVGRLININDRKQKEELLLLRSRTDAMTTLYNRGTTESVIQSRLSEPENRQAALIVADIDDLKRINDTFGHAEGDRAIRMFAEALRKRFRATDIVGRIGGDEFMALLCGSQRREALTEPLTRLVEDLGSLRVGGTDNSIAVTGSIGVALRSGSEDFDQLYRMADSALYHIKKQKKNGFFIFEEETPS